MSLSPRYDFANLLLSGACSARCPFCIGRQLNPQLIPPNLGEYPPRNLAAFIDLIRYHDIRQVAITGANTDPQIYRYERPLIERLRRDLPDGVEISLHTNGRQALQRIEVFRLYDRACISFPSFNPETYRRVMGVCSPPDLAEIIHRSRIPVKVSCVLTDHNLSELGGYLRRCSEIGIHRVALRKLYGDRRLWTALVPAEALGMSLRGNYRGSPIYDYYGVEVTLWDFEATQCRSINLFSSGEITTEYLLNRPNLDETSLHPSKPQMKSEFFL